MINFQIKRGMFEVTVRPFMHPNKSHNALLNHVEELPSLEKTFNFHVSTFQLVQESSHHILQYLHLHYKDTKISLSDINLDGRKSDLSHFLRWLVGCVRQGRAAHTRRPISFSLCLQNPAMDRCCAPAGRPLLSVSLRDMALKEAGELNRRLRWNDISNQASSLLLLRHGYLYCHMFTSACDLYSLSIVLEEQRLHRLSDGSDSTWLSPLFSPSTVIHSFGRRSFPSEPGVGREEELFSSSTYSV